MRTFIRKLGLGVLVICFSLGGTSWGCSEIASGVLKDGGGAPVTAEVNVWGYDYAKNTFDGGYCDAYHNAESCAPYKNVRLKMVWNNATLAPVDCNGDGNLDRHGGFATYKGSGAEITNEMTGTEILPSGESYTWTYTAVIKAVPQDAVLTNGMWYTSGGMWFGKPIWGDFAIRQEIDDDPLGKRPTGPARPGYTNY